MNNEYNSSSLRYYVKATSIVAVGIALIVFLGWYLNIPSLKSVFVGAATMKFNTALGFLCAGISLWFSQSTKNILRNRHIQEAFALLTLLIGFSSLMEYISGWDFGIDQIFIKDLLTPTASFPGRMSFITALCFSLCGLSLLLIDKYYSQFSSIGVMILSSLALVGYLFDYQSLYHLAGYGSVALHTAFTFLIVSLGLLAAKPSIGIMQLITSTKEGGRTLRQLLPISIAAVILLGWLTSLGQQFKFFNVQNSIAIFTILIILIYFPIYYFFANRINQAEDQIGHLNRLYATLSRVNQAIVHAQDRETLYQDICNAVIEEGKFHTAWIGVLDQSTGNVNIAAINGKGTETLLSIDININIPPYKTGLIGQSLHQGEIVTSNNIQTDERMIHWHAESRKQGYHAGAAVPFHHQGQVIGILNLYANEAGFFQNKEEIHLLEEIGGDISFALDTLEAKKAQSLLAAIVESSGDAIVTKDLNGVITSWNLGAELIFGYKTSEMVGQPILRLIPPNRLKEDDLILGQIKQGELIHHFETVRVRKDGSLIDVSLTISPIKDETGKVIGASKIARDISERKQSEEKLNFQALLLSQVRDAVIASDANYSITYWNHTAEDLYGWSAQEVLGKNGTQIVQTEFPNHAEAEEMRESIRKMGVWRGEVTQLKRDGTRFVCEVSSSVLFDESGNILGYVSVNRDITERKQMEQALAHSEKEFRTLAENALVGIFRTSVSRQELFVNHSLAHINGFDSPAEMAQQSGTLRFKNPADREALLNKLKEQGNVVNYELQILTKSNKVRDVLISATMEGDMTSGMVIDITERRQGEERFRLAIESAPNAILIVNKLGEILLVNPRTEKYFGYAQAEIVGKNVDELIPERFRESHRGFREVFYKEPLLRPMGAGRELYGLRKDNTEFPVEIGLAPIQTAEDLLIMATVVDITERKQVQAALTRSERDYRNLVENSLVGIFRTTVDGEFQFANHALAQIFGFDTSEELTSLSAILHYKSLADREALLTDLQKNGKIEQRELELVNKAGKVINVLVSIGIDGDIITGTTIDITERKRAERELQHTLGELKRSNTELEQFAYVASHDLQEPLRTITGMVQLLRQKYEGKLDGHAEQYISFTVEATTRMQALINDLLEFSRVERRIQPFEQVDINEVVEAVTKNLSRTINKNNAVITYDPLPTVKADPSQMIRLFQNLIGNAIKFRSEHPPKVHIAATRLNNAWEFSVRDNGIGIEPKYFERIFAIFQRLHTRAEYPGTGIGLSMCKKIVELHGGRIWVESIPGNGTTFHFTLS